MAAPPALDEDIDPHHPWHHTWLGTDRLLARGLARPVARFLEVEAASGLMLLAATLVALMWANSPWKGGYAVFLEREIGLEVGSWHLVLSTQEWINDGLMAVFFFVAGLEIKRELVKGELRDRKAAALPILAALGGMIVPALIYTLFNVGQPSAGGWGIPMATDIAFAVGIVSLLGPRVPVSLKLFLLTLAVADDLGAIGVIAVFYSQSVHFAWMAAAVAMLVLVYVLRRRRVWYTPIYVVLGVITWYFTLRSGIHATVAGVALGFLTPTEALRPDLDAEAIADRLENQPELTAADVQAASFLLKEAVPVGERLADRLVPWTGLRHHPGLRAGQRRHPADVGGPAGGGELVGHLGCRPRPRPREDDRGPGDVAVDHQARDRPLAPGSHPSAPAGDLDGRGHRLHGRPVRHRSGVRRAVVHRRGQGRHPRRLCGGGGRQWPGAAPGRGAGRSGGARPRGRGGRRAVRSSGAAAGDPTRLSTGCAGKPGRRSRRRPRGASAVRALHRLARLLHPEGPIVGRVTRPITRFLALEAASGLMLIGATVVAVVWANSPWSHSYTDLWHLNAPVVPGVDLDLHAIVNDALMAVFFFVVALEIRRELIDGDLRDRRTAALPVVAAAGGMIVPALIYLAVNAGHVGARGWGIPMATDIAFAVGVVSLLGRRVPPSLSVFLLTAAVVDDLGAIVVIALFYTGSVQAAWLGLAVVGVALLWLVGRRGWWNPVVFTIVAVLVWYATLRSGLHATLAGVALAAVVPRRGPEPVADQVMERLHPWSSYVIVPVFALANAGVALGGGAVKDALGSRVALGVVLGLVVGKTIGVAGAAALAIRTGLGRRPEGTGSLHLLGIGMVAGIGFTMSLFVTLLAFDSAVLVDEAKIGVFAASILAAAAGLTTLWFADRRASRSPAVGADQAAGSSR